ncbi:FecCD family ABC transporter permease [Leucobacter massiliensis]|uniref:Iron ABC transporter permease n=1 Tax=Leucobacter massiliensis TaxID=1686285 RepID=A0A2S9QLK5_9MICO|nr:iron chelate uptake ABC transporter family permease subunit [Leucobacter massiliensis]PRI10454.1 hypothetical protein B4915_11775 [Leucobacter massiliensis]
MNATTASAGRAYLHLRIGRARGRTPRRLVLACLAMLLLTLLGTAVALSLGDYPIPPDQLVAALTGADAGFTRTVVLEWRLPRALAAALFGLALGAAGAIFQAITRNPLATPDIIGFTTGSYTGALLVMVTFGSSLLGIATGALAGGLATASVIMALSMRRGLRGTRLVVVGIGVSAALAGVNAWILRTAEMEIAFSASAWGVGTLSRILAPQLLLTASAITVAGTVLAATGRSLAQLELGDEIAASSGLRVTSMRVTLIACAVLLVAAVTAFAGPIAFIALAAPAIGQRLTRAPGISLAASACAGAMLLTWADIVAQHGFPHPLPVGIITIVIGGAYLLSLLLFPRTR